MIVAPSVVLTSAFAGLVPFSLLCGGWGPNNSAFAPGLQTVAGGWSRCVGCRRVENARVLATGATVLTALATGAIAPTRRAGTDPDLLDAEGCLATARGTEASRTRGAGADGATRCGWRVACLWEGICAPLEVARPAWNSLRKAAFLAFAVYVPGNRCCADGVMPDFLVTITLGCGCTACATCCTGAVVADSTAVLVPAEAVRTSGTADCIAE